MSEQKKIAKRYPGVKPFSTEEHELFFGRNSDIRELYNQIFLRQTVVLFGKSGSGKSSLINAGIIPLLREEGSLLYFNIRFNNYTGKDIKDQLMPVQVIQKRLSECVEGSIDKPFDDLIPGEGSLWYWIKQIQIQKKKLKFVLFFDQFEELFTYPKQQIDEFSEQLADLLFVDVLPKYKAKMVELIEQHQPVGDDLYSQIFQTAEVKVVFSIRLDRLSLLNNLKDRHPAILHDWYELDAISVEDAMNAIREPARLSQEKYGFASPSFGYTDAAIDKIIENIEDKDRKGKIEAASTLQIICRHVEDNIVASNSDVMVSDDTLGDIEDIFQVYYQNILNKLPDAVLPNVHELVEEALISNNMRISLEEGFIANKYKVSKEILEDLEQSSLLRKERQGSKNMILYEVSHDTLIAPITKVAEGRKAIELQKEIEERERQERSENERKRIQLEEDLRIQKQHNDKQNELNRTLEKEKIRVVRYFRVTVVLTIVVLILIGSFTYEEFRINRQRKKKAEEESINVKHQMEDLQQKENAIDSIAREQAKVLAYYKFMEADKFRKEFPAANIPLEMYKHAFSYVKPYPDEQLHKDLKDTLIKYKEIDPKNY